MYISTCQGFLCIESIPKHGLCWVLCWTNFLITSSRWFALVGNNASIINDNLLNRWQDGPLMLVTLFFKHLFWHNNKTIDCITLGHNLIMINNAPAPSPPPPTHTQYLRNRVQIWLIFPNLPYFTGILHENDIIDHWKNRGFRKILNHKNVTMAFQLNGIFGSTNYARNKKRDFEQKSETARHTVYSCRIFGSWRHTP